MICKNCKSEAIQKYCPNCGNPVTLKKINGQYILKEISSVLNFDKGILHTIRELLLRPGKNIQTFILEDRGRLVKPITSCAKSPDFAQLKKHKIKWKL